MLVKRVTVAKHAEVVTAYCIAFAAELGTGQALCYQRTLAVGEVVGLNNCEKWPRAKQSKRNGPNTTKYSRLKMAGDWP